MRAVLLVFFLPLLLSCHGAVDVSRLQRNIIFSENQLPRPKVDVPNFHSISQQELGSARTVIYQHRVFTNGMIMNFRAG